jgi:hypothetical protein
MLKPVRRIFILALSLAAGCASGFPVLVLVHMSGFGFHLSFRFVMLWFLSLAIAGWLLFLLSQMIVPTRAVISGGNVRRASIWGVSPDCWFWKRFSLFCCGRVLWALTIGSRSVVIGYAHL